MATPNSSVRKHRPSLLTTRTSFGSKAGHWPSFEGCSDAHMLGQGRRTCSPQGSRPVPMKGRLMTGTGAAAASSRRSALDEGHWPTSRRVVTPRLARRQEDLGRTDFGQACPLLATRHAMGLSGAFHVSGSAGRAKGLPAGRASARDGMPLFLRHGVGHAVCLGPGLPVVRMPWWRALRGGGRGRGPRARAPWRDRRATGARG